MTARLTMTGRCGWWASALLGSLLALGGCALRPSSASEHLPSSPLLMAPSDERARSTRLRALTQARLQREAQHKSAGRAQRAQRRGIARQDASRRPASRAPISRTPISRVPASRVPAAGASASGSATPRSHAPQAPQAPPALATARGARGALQAAPRDASADSARYLSAVHHAHGVALPQGAQVSVQALVKRCKQVGALHFKTPEPGHIVFFHNTADVNGDGRPNDWHTHAALVVRRDGPQLTLLAYQERRGVYELWMNLERASRERDGLVTLNTALRARRAEDPPFMQYLAGELYAGTCALMSGGPKQTLRTWRP